MCVTLRLVYDALLALLGPDGLLFNYADDVYMGEVPYQVALGLSEAPSFYYAIVGLRLGWDPKKTKLVLPANCNRDDLPLPRDSVGNLLPDVVQGFKA